MGPEASGGGMPVPKHSPIDFIPHAAVAYYWILLGRGFVTHLPAPFRMNGARTSHAFHSSISLSDSGSDQLDLRSYRDFGYPGDITLDVLRLMQ